MKTTTKYLIIVIVGLSVLFSGSTAYIINREREIKRVSSNFKVLQHGMTQKDVTIRGLKHDIKLKASTIQSLVLSRAEIKEYYEKEIIEKLDLLSIKTRNLHSYTSVNSESNYSVQTKLKDSVVVVHDTVKVIAKIIDFSKPPWFNINGVIYDNELYGDIQTYDSLSIIIHRDRPKNIWFIKYGKWIFKEDIINFNPYNDIKSSLFIENKKHKK